MKSWRKIIAQSSPPWHDNHHLAKLDIGKHIYYLLPDLDKWLEALEE
jgi:hypothetical protein